MLTAQIFVEPMPFKLLIVRWLLLAISVQTVFSRPIQESINTRRRVRSTPIYEDVQGYLMKFGYLPESDLETGYLRDGKQLHDALRTLQTFGNIPITGQLDEATKQLMKKSRCGVSDTVQPVGQRRTKRYTLQGQKWHHVNLTWSLRTRRLDKVNHGWVRSDLNRAFQVWAKYSKLTFREVNSESADILVFFEKGYHGDGYPFDGPGLVLAHAFFPGTGRGGDAHFDEEEEWLVADKTSQDGTSLFRVAVHEFGHSLGLSHSSVNNSLMYPWYQDLKSDFELPKDDQIGIQILYGAKNDKIWGDIPAYRPTPQTPELSTTVPKMSTTARTVVTKSMNSIPTSVTPVTSTTSRTMPPRRPDVVVVDDKPDFCNTSFDAVSVIRKDTFFFKGKYTWRLGLKGLYPGYPALISRLWYNLPDDMKRVDAVYERQDGKIVFFIGRDYYLFDGNNPLPGYPKPLTVLGLPEELDRVDAAIVWGHNSKTYIFSGTMYWRCDDETNQMELDYPRDMSIWRGAGYNIDAAFQWHDGATYFFKNRDFWKFNDLRMRVEQEEPRSIGEFWFNCTATGGTGNRWPNTKIKGRTTGLKGVTSSGGRFRTADDDPSSSYDVSSSGSVGGDHTPPPIVTWSVTMASIATIVRWAR